MLKTTVSILVILLLAAAGLAGWLWVSAPSTAESVPFATSSHLRLLRLAPADARVAVLVPSASGFLRELERSKATAPAVAKLGQRYPLNAVPWLVGGADLVAWGSPGGSGFAFAPDIVRRAALTVWAWFYRPAMPFHSEGRYVVFGSGEGGFDSGPFLESAGGLSGEAFVLQSDQSKLPFPPVSRPSISAATVDRGALRIVARADGRKMAVPSVPLAFDFYPRGAILAASSAEFSSWMEQADPLLLVHVSQLFDGGGMIALYRIDSGRILPRVKGVAVLPESASTDGLMAKLDQLAPRISVLGMGTERRTYRGVEIVRRVGLGYVVEYARANGRVLVALDKSSIEQFLDDTLVRVALPKERTQWFLHIRPQELLPVVDRLRGRQELSILAPDLYRTIENARSWIEYASGASSVLISRQTEDRTEIVTITAEEEK